MKDFHPAALFAITEAMLGGWFWVVLAGAVLVVALWLVALLRRFGSLRRTGAATTIVAFAVAIAAAALAPTLTDARFADLNGTVDYAILAIVAVSCGLGAAVVVWPVAALLRGRATPQR